MSFYWERGWGCKQTFRIILQVYQGYITLVYWKITFSIWWWCLCYRFLTKLNVFENSYSKYSIPLRLYITISNDKLYQIFVLTLRFCRNHLNVLIVAFGSNKLPQKYNSNKSSLKSHSHHPKNCYLLDWKPFKNDEKCLLFHLKSSFRSQVILVFLATFLSCRKMVWLER